MDSKKHQLLIASIAFQEHPVWWQSTYFALQMIPSSIIWLLWLKDHKPKSWGEIKTLGGLLPVSVDTTGLGGPSGLIQQNAYSYMHQ